MRLLCGLLALGQPLYAFDFLKEAAVKLWLEKMLKDKDKFPDLVAAVRDSDRIEDSIGAILKTIDRLNNEHIHLIARMQGEIAAIQKKCGHPYITVSTDYDSSCSRCDVCGLEF